MNFRFELLVHSGCRGCCLWMASGALVLSFFVLLGMLLDLRSWFYSLSKSCRKVSEMVKKMAIILYKIENSLETADENNFELLMSEEQTFISEYHIIFDSQESPSMSKKDNHQLETQKDNQTKSKFGLNFELSRYVTALKTSGKSEKLVRSISTNSSSAPTKKHKKTKKFKDIKS